MQGDPQMLMELIMKALQVSGYSGGQDHGDGLAGLDPDNQVRGWSGINIVRGADDRPSIADKDYVIEKLALGSGQTMPQDHAADNYTRPF